MKRTLLLVGISVGLLFPAGALANATGSLRLDSYHDWSRHYTPPVSTSYTMPKHARYVVTVSGTLSYYPAIDYSHPQPPWTVVCGKPEPSTQYSGSLGGSGPVGFDAEFIFARPWRVRKCARHPLPVHWADFQVDTGNGWSHPNILGPWLSTPTGDHTYSYAIIGEGDPASFRLHDVYTRDNYGILKIRLRPAGASDCASYVALGFKSLAICQSQLAAKTTGS